MSDHPPPTLGLLGNVSGTSSRELFQSQCAGPFSWYEARIICLWTSERFRPSIGPCGWANEVWEARGLPPPEIEEISTNTKGQGDTTVIVKAQTESGPIETSFASYYHLKKKDVKQRAFAKLLLLDNPSREPRLRCWLDAPPEFNAENKSKALLASRGGLGASVSFQQVRDQSWCVQCTLFVRNLMERPFRVISYSESVARALAFTHLLSILRALPPVSSKASLVQARRIENANLKQDTASEKTINVKRNANDGHKLRREWCQGVEMEIRSALAIIGLGYRVEPVFDTPTGWVLHTPNKGRLLINSPAPGRVDLIGALFPNSDEPLPRNLGVSGTLSTERASSVLATQIRKVFLDKYQDALILKSKPEKLEKPKPSSRHLLLAPKSRLPFEVSQDAFVQAESRTFQDGFMAAVDGRDDCPYSSNHLLSYEWRRGAAYAVVACDRCGASNSVGARCSERTLFAVPEVLCLKCWRSCSPASACLHLSPGFASAQVHEYGRDFLRAPFRSVRIYALRRKPRVNAFWAFVVVTNGLISEVNDPEIRPYIQSAEEIDEKKLSEICLLARR